MTTYLKFSINFTFAYKTEAIWLSSFGIMEVYNFVIITIRQCLIITKQIVLGIVVKLWTYSEYYKKMLIKLFMYIMKDESNLVEELK